jgi:hypothetical protein
VVVVFGTTNETNAENDFRTNSPLQLDQRKKLKRSPKLSSKLGTSFLLGKFSRAKHFHLPAWFFSALFFWYDNLIVPTPATTSQLHAPIPPLRPKDETDHPREQLDRDGHRRSIRACLSLGHFPRSQSTVFAAANPETAY